MRAKKHSVSAALALSLGMLCQTVWANDAAAKNEESLLAFIGQKASLTEQKRPPCDDCLMRDAHYLATYRILDTVHGNYRGSTITFDVYDHGGVPAFSKYETVLLYVREQANGTWRHEKYQFHDLYKGIDGEWYGCGDPYARTPDATRTVHARPVQFAQAVSYPIAKFEPDFVKRRYPKKYFEISNGQAVCLLGTSIPDLIKAKQETDFVPRSIVK